MEERPDCPISLSQLLILQKSADLDSTCSKTLAQHLPFSRSTIDTYFTQMIEFMGVDSRMGVVRKALKNGWIEDSPHSRQRLTILERLLS